jgi:hypothetical protein
MFAVVLYQGVWEATSVLDPRGKYQVSRWSCSCQRALETEHNSQQKLETEHIFIYVHITQKFIKDVDGWKDT